MVVGSLNFKWLSHTFLRVWGRTLWLMRLQSSRPIPYLWWCCTLVIFVEEYDYYSYSSSFGEWNCITLHKQSWSTPVYIGSKWRDSSCSELCCCARRRWIRKYRCHQTRWNDFYFWEEFLFDVIYSYWMDLVTIGCIRIERTNGLQR